MAPWFQAPLLKTVRSFQSTTFHASKICTIFTILTSLELRCILKSMLCHSLLVSWFFSFHQYIIQWCILQDHRLRKWGLIRRPISGLMTAFKITSSAQMLFDYLVRASCCGRGRGMEGTTRPWWLPGTELSFGGPYATQSCFPSALPFECWHPVFSLIALSWAFITLIHFLACFSGPLILLMFGYPCSSCVIEGLTPFWYNSTLTKQRVSLM